MASQNGTNHTGRLQKNSFLLSDKKQKTRMSAIRVFLFHFALLHKSVCVIKQNYRDFLKAMIYNENNKSLRAVLICRKLRENFDYLLVEG